MAKLILQNIISLFTPSPLKRIILNWFGHDIHRDARVGIVFLGNKVVLNLDCDTYIKNFNWFKCNIVSLRRGATIKNLNMFSGEFDVDVGESATVGNFNRFGNSSIGLKERNCKFSIGRESNVTSYHYFDLTESICIGTNSVIGGSYSQFWTHGFRHFDKGSIRLRVDGGINIGDGVYLGSRVLVNPGVVISDSVSVGAGAIVSKNLLSAGMYVSERLRLIKFDDEAFYSRYKANEEGQVRYFKRRE